MKSKITAIMTLISLGVLGQSRIDTIGIKELQTYKSLNDSVYVMDSVLEVKEDGSLEMRGMIYVKVCPRCWVATKKDSPYIMTPE